MRRKTLKFVLVAGSLLGAPSATLAQEQANDAPSAAASPGQEARQSYESVSDLFYNWKAVVGRVAIDLQALKSDFQQTDFKVSGTYSERLARAEVAYLLKDYHGASLALYGLTDKASFASQPGYSKAMYYLAESLYQVENFGLSRNYFQQVLKEVPARRAEALRRLIQIADALQDDELFAFATEEIEEASAYTPEVAYAVLRFAARTGKVERIDGLLAGIPREHPLYVRSLYMAAVANVRIENLRPALKYFEAAEKAASDDDRQMVELIALNKARVLLELGVVAEAVDTYQIIDRTSERFDEALFEVTWAYVEAAKRAQTNAQRRDNYEKALNAIEILLLAVNDQEVASQARLLMGNIYLQLGRFADATDTFNQITQSFGRVRDEVQGMLDGVDAGESLVDRIVAEQGGGPALLPPIARDFASKDIQLEQSILTLNSLEDMDVALSESESITRNIIAALDASEKEGVTFPAFQPLQTRSLSLRKTLEKQESHLRRLERLLVEPVLSQDERLALQNLSSDLDALDKKLADAPSSVEEFDQKVGELRARFGTLQKEAYKLRWRLEEQEKTLLALQTWIHENPESLPIAEEAIFRSSLEQQEQVIEQLRLAQDELEAEINREKQMISMVDIADGGSKSLKLKLGDSIEAERDILALAGDRLTGAPGALYRNMLSERGELSRLYIELTSFDKGLGEIESTMVARLRADVLLEMKDLEEQRSALKLAMSNARAVVGDIALASVKVVRDGLTDVVQRGDLGLIDVAWEAKERQTDEIDELIKKQNEAIREVEAQFKSVLPR